MVDQPLIPRSRTNPVGQTQRIRRARRAINRRLRRIERMLIERWLKLPVQIVVINQFYDYQISLDVLRAIVDLLVQELRETGQEELAEQVMQVYREGTSKAVENLARISDDYTRTVTQALGSRAVQRRAALAGSRVFEQMRGFGEDTSADLARVLFQAVQDGTNPRVVAGTIRERFGVSRTRAARIARTEITMALRRGRMDEAADAQERFGLQTRLLHYSALIPERTRMTHAQRHGRIVTIQDQREWYARDGNGVNCLCTATEIIVDDEGKPVTGVKLVERLIDQRRRFTGVGA